MTEEQAQTAIELRCAHDADPQLDSAAVAWLVEFAKRADSQGRPPSDDGWEPTWNLDSAAAEGWRLKAAKAASMFNFEEDGQRLALAQVHAHCLEQEQAYLRRITQSLEVTQ